MSCSLRSLPSLPDLCHLKTLLFPEGPVPGESNQDDDYDNRWSWPDDGDLRSEKKNDGSELSSWVDKCLTAISPDASFFVIAYDQRILCLCLRQSSWTVSCCKTVEGMSYFEKITSLTLIPFLSQFKSNDGGIDWTALLVGSTHGMLRVLTAENATPLIIQKFCEDPLRSIKASSFYSHVMTGQRRHCEQHDQLDDILLVFKNMVAVIEGFAFYQTVRSTRNQLAKLPLHENAVKHVLEMKISLQANKWFLDSPSTLVGSEENVIRDVESGGESVSTSFDQMVTASFFGPNSRPKKAKSSATQFITTGKTPFLGFFRTVEVEQPSLLNNVAHAAVSKVKNIFFTSKNEESKSSDSHPVRIVESLGIYDQFRQGLSIIFSRDKSLAVVTDDFGRVSLIDAVNWLVIRMWKGYRDAQCALITISEDNKNLSSRKCNCLVIYVAKRGLLEIWKLDLVPRLASFSVGKKCLLFHSSHTVFGMNPKILERDAFANEPKVFLFDYSCGKLFDVEIPFVCTLTDENSRSVRDEHFIKVFKHALLQGDRDRQLIPMKQIQSKSAKAELLNLALDSGVEDAEFIAKSFIEVIMQDTDNPEQDLDIEHKLFLQSCYRVLQLIKLYEFLSSKQDFHFSCCDFQVSHPTGIHDFSASMSWSEVDVTKCLSLFTLRHSVVKPLDAPSLRTLISFQDFISFFVIETTRVIKSDEDDKVVLANLPIDVKWKLDSSHCSHDSLSKFIFEIIFNEDADDDSKDLFHSLDESCITSKSLLHLLFMSWLSIPSLCDNWNNWAKFSVAAQTIGQHLTEAPDDDQSLPHSWQVVCCNIISCKNIPSALIATFLVKNVTEQQLMITKDKPKKLKAKNEEGASKVEDEQHEEKEDEDNDWETLHVDKERLNIVTKQMEDVFLLNLLLQTSISGNRFGYESQSLAQLINSDSGIVSELVSRWTIALDLEVELIKTLFKSNSDEEAEEADEMMAIDTDQSLKTKSAEEGQDAMLTNQSKEEEEKETIKELLLHVQRCFPHSLRREVILINSCWECVSIWSKNVENEVMLSKALSLLNSLSSSYLKHSLSCLVWKTFLLKQLEILTLQTEKMSKIPKDRILRKELSITEDSLESFLSFSLSLLEVILENVSNEDYLMDYPVFAIDDWWSNGRHHRDRRPPLILFASSAAIKQSNSSVVLPHVHLVQVMIFMAIFQLKNIKPISLFNSVTRQVLFKDLSLQFIASSNQETTIDDNRVYFLQKVIMSIAQSIPCDSNSGEKSELLLNLSRVYNQATKWFSIVLTLASEWNLDTDLLRRRYVSELYANHCDSLAEEVSEPLTYC